MDAQARMMRGLSLISVLKHDRITCTRTKSGLLVYPHRLHMRAVSLQGTHLGPTRLMRWRHIMGSRLGGRSWCLVCDALVGGGGDEGRGCVRQQVREGCLERVDEVAVRHHQKPLLRTRDAQTCHMYVYWRL